MSTPAVHQTPEERAANLRKANRVRIARAKLRRDLKSGERTAIQVFQRPPQCLRITNGWQRARRSVPTIVDVIAWQPQWGYARASGFLKKLDMGETVCIHELSASRRRQLVAALRDPSSIAPSSPQTIPLDLGLDLARALTWAISPQGEAPVTPEKVLTRFKHEVGVGV